MTTTNRTFMLVSRSAAAMLLLGASACSDDGDDSPSDTGFTDTADVGGTDGGADVGTDVATGCEVTPGAWDTTDYETNAAGGLALRAQMDLLQSATMNAAEQSVWGDAPTTAPTLEELIAIYEDGIADWTTTAFDAVIRDVLADWVGAMANDPATYAFVDADGINWIATAPGGLYERSASDDGTRRFRAYSNSGVELRQIVDKGLFVNAGYSYALSLTEGEITPGTIQDIAAAWGANMALNVSPGEDEESNTDSSNYARTMGLYDEVADALIAAQAYAADDSCGAELDAAIVDIFRGWEEGMFARGTYYTGAPWRATLDATDVDTIMTPLHAAAEGWGLIGGMLDIVEPTAGPLMDTARVSTDDDIANILEAVGVELSDVSAGEAAAWLVEEPATYNTAFEGIFKTTVQGLFGWDEDTFNIYATSPVANE